MPEHDDGDLDVLEAAYARQGWKFNVRYDASCPDYLARARKAWTLHICSASGDTRDEARVALLNLMDESLNNPDWPRGR